MGSTRILVEAPCFGFGPVSSLSALMEGCSADVEWVLVSTGSALKYWRERFPGSSYIDVDTFTSDSVLWQRKIGRGNRIISSTNPIFASWAIDAGNDVGIVDTLDWMWDELPNNLGSARFYHVQSYLISSRSAAQRHGFTVQFTGPMSNPLRPSSTKKAAENLVISFGGMESPRGEAFVGRYVNWILSEISPTLKASAEPYSVWIFGGLPNLDSYVPLALLEESVSSVHVYAGASHDFFMSALHRGLHVLLAPGLTTLYECGALHCDPFLLPGYNMSMLLQARTIRELGYPHLVEPPDTNNLIGRLSTMSEHEGLPRVESLIGQMTGTSGTGLLKEPLEEYLSRSGHDHKQWELFLPKTVESSLEVFNRAMVDWL
jgi:hypothetical protein